MKGLPRLKRKQKGKTDLKRIALIWIVMAAVLIPYEAQASRTSRPKNLLLIIVDTLRADRLSCYGSHEVQTPWIDKLAQRGTLFTRAFAHTPLTLPSHANILIGTTPLIHGVHENTSFVVKEESLTLAEFLKGKGFSTAAFIGGFPLDSRFGLDQGFDVYDDEFETSLSQKFSYGERKAELVVDRALAWLKGRESPWFLWVHVFDPHEPYVPPSPFQTKYQDQPYDGEVAYVDQELGRLIDGLEKNGLFEETLVIFTSDHGESLGEHGEMTHGFLAYNSTLWVPLIIVQPARKHVRIDDYVCHTDIFPTVCDIFKLRAPSHLDGISLVNSMKGRRLPQRTIYIESLYPFYQRNWAPIQGFIADEEKFIKSPLPELYDLKSDFLEQKNLASQSVLGEYNQKLQKILSSGVPLGSESNRRTADKETLEKLSSLGYISGYQTDTKQHFGPEDNVKVLLPFYNSVIKAINLHYDGKSEQATRMIRKVITERPDVDIAYSKLAEIYQDQGRLGDSIAVLQLGLDKLPSSYEILSSLVNALMDARHYQQVIQLVSQSNHRMKDYDPEIWNYVGIAHMHLGELDEALESFEKALSIDPEYASIDLNFGNTYLLMFLRDNKEETLAKCIDYLEKAIASDPGSAMAHNSLGAALRKSGRLKDAIEAWEKALELNPKLKMAIYNLGKAYYDLGDKSQALVFLQRYLRSSGSQISPDEKKELENLIAECRK